MGVKFPDSFDPFSNNSSLATTHVHGMTYFSLRSCSLSTFQLAILYSNIARSRDSDLVLADGGLLLTVTETPIAIHAEYNQEADGSNTTRNRSETQGPKTPAFTTRRTGVLLTRDDGEELSAVSKHDVTSSKKQAIPCRRHHFPFFHTSVPGPLE
jgi:hypothetical protein